MIQKNFIKLYEESFARNFELPALSDYTSDISYSSVSYTHLRAHET